LHCDDQTGKTIGSEAFHVLLVVELVREARLGLDGASLAGGVADLRPFIGSAPIFLLVGARTASVSASARASCIVAGEGGWSRAACSVSIKFSKAEGAVQK
jgi:hypothetical protein